MIKFLARLQPGRATRSLGSSLRNANLPETSLKLETHFSWTVEQNRRVRAARDYETARFPLVFTEFCDSYFIENYCISGFGERPQLDQDRIFC